MTASASIVRVRRDCPAACESPPVHHAGRVDEPNAVCEHPGAAWRVQVDPLRVRAAAYEGARARANPGPQASVTHGPRTARAPPRGRREARRAVATERRGTRAGRRWCGCDGDGGGGGHRRLLSPCLHPSLAAVGRPSRRRAPLLRGREAILCSWQRGAAAGWTARARAVVRWGGGVRRGERRGGEKRWREEVERRGGSLVVEEESWRTTWRWALSPLATHPSRASPWTLITLSAESPSFGPALTDRTSQ